MKDDELKNCGSVVLITPCCGAVVMIAVNHPKVLDEEMRLEIGNLVADGCRVEHWTREDVKTKPWEMGCKCKSHVESK